MCDCGLKSRPIIEPTLSIQINLKNDEMINCNVHRKKSH